MSLYYSLLKNILFLLPPETAHHVALQSLKLAYQLHLLKTCAKKAPRVSIMGLNFPNLIGLAAGLDKDARYIDALAALGFGYLEIGTITPKAQIGNPKPRLFRLVKEEALINRMGFNNEGVLSAMTRLKKIKYRGILGISIGKNKDTPLHAASEDYLFCMQHLWPFASYFALNLSSPNTPELRELQKENYLPQLLSTLKKAQHNILQQHKKYIPLVVKIAPDLTENEIHAIANTSSEYKIDGIIATNTTINHPYEKGGLSGKPLQAKSTWTIQMLRQSLKDTIPIIGCGGIYNKASAYEKLQAGANLLQIYTGFIYHGPKLIHELSSI